MNKLIYVDNAATTKVSKPVLESMLPYFSQEYGNPSTLYSLGKTAMKAVEKARGDIVNSLGCQKSEIYFTAGGSESDNWAIKGVAYDQLKKGKNHIISSKFEHHAVLHTLQALEREGFDVTYLDVYKNGLVRLEDVENAIGPKTALVTIMYANNEIGTVQPIKEISKICKDKGVVFHTDAVQAIGNIKINLDELGVDLLSLSAHKFYGPKGIGALYIKKGVKLQNLIEGGNQENGKRGGTENVASIVGMATAIVEACSSIDDKNEKLIFMRDYLIDEFLKLPKTVLNGDRKHRLPGNVNVSFNGVEGESLILMLAEKGICASSGSACTSGSLDPSHVLLAIGLPHESAHGSLRITLSEENTMEEVKHVVTCVKEVAEKLRSMSPVWDKIK